MLIWLATFMLHSTIWCLLAWAVVSIFSRMSPAAKERIWYGAIAISIITPTLQLATSSSMSLWEVKFPWILIGEHEFDKVSATWSIEHRTIWIAAAWATLTSIILVSYVIRLNIFYQRIGKRTPITDDRLVAAANEFSKRAGFAISPKLSVGMNLTSPIAIGIGSRREICIPVIMIDRLDESQLRAIVGHEMAHHARHDVFRLFLLHFFQAVFFFQPLFRIVSKSIHRVADEQCDAWSSHITGDPYAVARCLLEVGAESGKPLHTVLVPCMASGNRSVLAQRVDLLLRPVQHSPRITFRIILLVLCVVPACFALLPSASFRDTRGEAADHHRYEDHYRGEHH